jgi:hypothetical protein
MRSKISFLLALLSAFTSSFASAAVFPTGPSLNVGGFTFTDFTNTLQICTGTTAATHGGTFRLSTTVTATGYTPSGGKAFRIRMLSVQNQLAGTGYAGFLGYADNDVGFDSASAQTNPKYFTGQSGAASIAVASGIGTTYFPVNFLIPNTKYGFMYQTSSSSDVIVCAFGAEE